VTDVKLGSLAGTNPLGFLAALGALDGAQRQRPARKIRLAWTDTTIPRAVISGTDGIDDLVAALDADRAMWTASPMLTGGGAGPINDLKLSREVLGPWWDEVRAASSPGGAEERLLAALIAPGALDGSGKKAKPTHLDFTAGQQQFLKMARTLSVEVDAAMIKAALIGDWSATAPLPAFGWDSEGERIYALRAMDPSTEKKEGVPGANWLAFVGLSFFPTWVSPSGDGLRTLGCEPGWKRSALTWPIWADALTVPVVRSLLRDGSLSSTTEDLRRQRGVLALYRAPIRRTDQGGYGSFGGAAPVLPAAQQAMGVGEAAPGRSGRVNPLLRTRLEERR
jgi:hypothetical protein